VADLSKELLITLITHFSQEVFSFGAVLPDVKELRRIRVALLLAFFLLLSGCTYYIYPEYSQRMATVDKIALLVSRVEVEDVSTLPFRRIEVVEKIVEQELRRQLSRYLQERTQMPVQSVSREDFLQNNYEVEGLERDLAEIEKLMHCSFRLSAEGRTQCRPKPATEGDERAALRRLGEAIGTKVLCVIRAGGNVRTPAADLATTALAHGILGPFSGAAGLLAPGKRMFVISGAIYDLTSGEILWYNFNRYPLFELQTFFENIPARKGQ
jgi:hypothetical protein